MIGENNVVGIASAFARWASADRSLHPPFDDDYDDDVTELVT